MSRFAALPLAVALSACPISTPTPTEVRDAGQELVGRSCNVDAECGGLRCDKLRRVCICLSDDSCAPEQGTGLPRYCNNYTGLCVSEITGCTQDSQCNAEEYCDPSTRTCTGVKAFCETCRASNECGGQDDNCLTETSVTGPGGAAVKFCGKACTDDAQCPRGATCQMLEGSRQCWPKRMTVGTQPTCRNFQGCTPDSLRSCTTSQECADSTQRCDLTKGRCVAVQQVCPFGTTCDPRVRLCVDDCVVDADCGNAQLRCVNRVCVPVSECRGDSDCAGTEVCSKAPGATVGRCTPFCTGDAECPLGYTCQRSGARFSCQPGCANNAGCSLDQRCNLTSRVCEGPIVGGTRTCQATAACAACELCDPVRSECSAGRSAFPFCSPCTLASDCPGGSCVQLADGNSYCGRNCGMGQDCPRGFTCSTLTTGGQACVPADRSCTGKCP